jgi:CBS domain containing-hemolysin-like protein
MALSHGLAVALAACGMVLFAVLLAVVSAAEQTFLSITEAQIRRLKDRENGRAERVLDYVRRPHHVIVTTIVASGVFSAGAILCFLLLVSRAAAVTPPTLLAGGLLAGLLLAVFARALPRARASVSPETSAFRLVRVYSVVEALFRPLTWAVRKLLGRVAEDPKSELVAVAEFKAVTDEDDSTPRLQDEKRELIHSIFEFGDTTAKEVMVPRIDMVMAEAGTSRRDLLKLIEEHGHSRIPIYAGSVDEVIGAVHVKQLVRNGSVDSGAAPVRDLVRPVIFVPETKKIDELLQEFQQTKGHLAIVVDEYGGTSGMVTLEDVIEEIVGEIEDEYDTQETLVEPLPDGTWRVAAKIDIDDLNEEMNLNLPTENSDTLGGFIYELVGKVPSQGEAVEYQNLRFVIDRVHRQRIMRVRIQKAEQARA